MKIANLIFTDRFIYEFYFTVFLFYFDVFLLFCSKTSKIERVVFLLCLMSETWVSLYFLK